MAGKENSDLTGRLFKIFLLLFIIPLFFQAQPVTFQKIYGGTNYEVGFAMDETADGGYIVAGYTTSTEFGASANLRNFYVVKTDQYGEAEWINSYDEGNQQQQASSIKQISGGYITCGYGVFGGLKYIFLMKMDNTGNPVWTRRYTGGGGFEIGASLVQTDDNSNGTLDATDGFVIAATLSTGTAIVWLKIDKDGNVTDSKQYAKPGTLTQVLTNFVDIKQTDDDNDGEKDDGYIIVGAIERSDGGWIIKTDITGQCDEGTVAGTWMRTFGLASSSPSKFPYLRSVIQAADDGFAITGKVPKASSDSVMLFLKLLENGTLDFCSTYGGSDVTAQGDGYSIEQTDDNYNGVLDVTDGYIIGGTTREFGYGRLDGQLVKVDKKGNVEWSKIYGGDKNDEVMRAVKRTSDNGYALFGNTKSVGQNSGSGPPATTRSDFYLVKTDSLGQTDFCSGFTPSTNQNEEDFDPSNIILNGYEAPPTVLAITTVTVTPSYTVVTSVSQVYSPCVILDFANTTVCYGNSTTFTGTAEGSPTISGYSWNFGDAGTSTTWPLVAHQYTLAGTYSATLSASNGFPTSIYFSSVTQNVVVYALPTIQVVADDLSPCIGTSTNLTALGASGGSYIWSPETYLNSSTGQTVTFTSSVLGTYTYTITGSGINGCVNDTTVIITLHALPTVEATANNPFCVNSSIDIDAQGAFTYAWSPATNLSGTTGDQVVFEASVATTYTVNLSGTDINGCVNDTFLVITLNPLPTLTSMGSVTVCKGSSTILTVSGTGISSADYSWQPSTWLDNTNNSSVIATPTLSGATTYSISGRDGNNCRNTTYLLLTSIASPSISASAANSLICLGDNTELSAQSSQTNYVWLPATDLSSSTGSPVTFTPSGNGNYTYSVTITEPTYNCRNTALTTVTVVATLPVNAGEDVTICSGESQNITASGGASSYTWNTGNIGSVISVSPAVKTSYTVTGTTGNCSASDSVTVFVNSLPTLNISSGNTSICQGSGTQLTATGAAIYTWSAGTTPSSGPIVSVSPSGSTTFIVTGTDNNNCTSEATIPITIFSLPVIDAGQDMTIISGQATELNATSTGALTYVWSTGESASSITVSPLAETRYTVSGTDNNGCSETDTVVVYVTVICNDPYVPNAFSPNGDGQNEILYVEDKNCSAYSPLNFSIYDRWGNKVFEAFDIKDGWDGKSKGIDLPTGVYVYELQVNSILKMGNITLIR